MQTSKQTNKGKAKAASKSAAKAAPVKAAAHKEAKKEHKVEAKPAKVAAKPAAKAHHGEGARTLGAPAFVINRKWTKPVESHVGATLRVELPENRLQGMSWQLQKLPHGVALTQSEVQAHHHEATQAHSMSTQNRVFDFAVEEEGDYLLQFTLGRPFAQAGFVDQFRVKLQAKKN